MATHQFHQKKSKDLVTHSPLADLKWRYLLSKAALCQCQADEQVPTSMVFGVKIREKTSRKTISLLFERPEW